MRAPNLCSAALTAGLTLTTASIRPPPHARVHDLRYIHATTLFLAGVPVHVVAARLGHADPAITLRVYAHVIKSAEIIAADVFARALEDDQTGG